MMNKFQTAPLEGKPIVLHFYGGAGNEELMSKEEWMERYVTSIKEKSACSDTLAREAAEAAFDPEAWSDYTPEEAADEEIACWDK